MSRPFEIKHPVLGIEFKILGTHEPSEKDIWDAIKLTQPPEIITNAYFNGGEPGKQVARDAYRNGFFEGGIGEALGHIGGLAVEGGKELTGRMLPGRAGTEGAALRRKYDAVDLDATDMKQAASTGLGRFFPWKRKKEPSRKYGGDRLDPKDMKRGAFTYKNEKGEIRDLYDHREGLKKAGIQLHGLMAAGVDGDIAMDQVVKMFGMEWFQDQKEVKKWISLYQGMFADDSLRATGYQAVGNIVSGYQTIGELGSAFAEQAILEGDEQVDNWIEAYAKVNELEKARQKSARQVALLVGDDEVYKQIKSGDVVPSEGLAFLTEIVADPANVLGFGVAKGVMSTQRAALTGLTRKTLIGLEKDIAEQTALQGRAALLKNIPAPTAAISKRLVETEAELAKLAANVSSAETTLAKYGGKGLVGRLTGSPVSALAAERALDLTTESGKAASAKLRNALRPVANKTLVSRLGGSALALGGTLTEIGGRVSMFLRAMPENAALAAIHKVTAKELTEAEAKAILFKMLALGGGGYIISEKGDVGGELVAGLAAYFGPQALATVGRDMRVIGQELSLARSTDPFFRRLGALPTPSEGLVGAAKDRTNVLTQGFWQATKAAATDPAKQTFRKTAGGALGTERYIGSGTKGVSRFLDRSGMGRLAEGAGRFGEAMGEGSIIPVGIGYVGSGGELAGAAVGGAISTPFTALGAGVGKLANFKNKGDLIQKQLGDVEYYRDHLNRSEKKDFDSMPAGIRIALAEYSLSNPDLIFRGESWGKGGGRGSHQVLDEGSVAVYNKDSESPMRPAFAHESMHHLESHGLMAEVNRIMFGDPEQGTAGVYVKRTDKGEPIYLRDADGELILHPVTGRKQWELIEVFHQYRNDYLTLLAKTRGLDSAEMAAYQQSPERMGRELLAEMGADLQLSGKLQKHLDKGPVGKLMEGVAKVIFGPAFTKNLMLKLGVAIDKNGEIVRSDIFKKLQRVPEIDALIKKYKRDTAGKRRTEIEEAFPISEEVDQSFSIQDQKDPNIVDLMNTGGVFKTNPDGSLVLDAMRQPIRMTKSEIDAKDEAASKYALGVLEKHGIPIDDVSTTKNGITTTKKTATFKRLTEEMIDDLAKGPWHSRQIDMLRQIARSLREGDGAESGFLLGYFAASKGRKPKALPYKMRTAMPYQFKLTQGGNILIELIDPNILNKNLKFLKKKFPKESALFKSDSEIFDDLRTYTANQVAGRPGPTGLGDAKAIFLNALLGGFTKAQVELNPILNSIGWKQASSNTGRGAFGVALRSFRLDRIFSAERFGDGLALDYRRAEQLRMPRARDDETVPLPFIENLGGEKPAAGMERIYTEKMNRREYDAYQKASDSPDVALGAGNTSQVQPFQPRFPKSERQFMPAEGVGLKDNIIEDVLPRITQVKLSPPQLQAALAKTAGAKSYADEIGLTEFVKGRKSITKDEVEVYVRENSPKLEVEVLGGPTKGWTGPTKFYEYQEPGGTNYREVKVKLPKAEKLYNKKLAEIAERHGRSDDPTGYSKYATPEEAAELRALAEKSINEIDEGVGVFSDPNHFGDNVLLWLRLNDRIDADGKRVLFIEELQSNWHQEGRKEGYQLSESEKNVLRKEFDELKKVYDEPGAFDRMTEITDMLQGKGEFSKGVPDAPFKKNWPALAMKMAVKEAIEGGYDRVAWLDGEGQAARYDLSQHVDSIVHAKNMDGTYDIEVIVDNSVELGKRNQSPKQLEELVGKEIVQKITNNRGTYYGKPRKPTQAWAWKELTRIDLKVGGEGMKAFYDREMRSIASKISKKIKGGKVEREGLRGKQEGTEIFEDVGSGRWGVFDRNEVLIKEFTNRIEAERRVELDKRDFGESAGFERKIMEFSRKDREKEFNSHAFDLPKDPTAVDNLRLYMPAGKAPSDARPPSLMKERQFMPEARPMVAGRDEKMFMPAEEAGAPKGKVNTESDSAPLPGSQATFFQWDAVDRLNKGGRAVLSIAPGKNRTIVAQVERGAGMTDSVIIKADGTFDAGESNILYMPGDDSSHLPYKVSTRNPTAVKSPENPLTSDLVIGLEAIEADPKMLHSHAYALQEYPGIKRTSRSPKVIAEKFIDHVVDNLLWLYDQVAPEVRERSRLWYDGARRIVDRWSEEFGSTHKTIGGPRSTPREKQGIAAALAALSPQKDWFMNVDLARRILDVMTFKKREKFDSAMVDKYIEKFSESLGRKEASKIANAMKGKTLEELPTNYEQAAFVRAYDEVYNPREYQVVSPEGEFIGISRKQNGEPDSVAWGSMSEIAKAVRVLRDPTHRNISEALGQAHKIRNFYNNILLPKADKLSVTIDTHAIAAALLRALAGADLEVSNNFGTKPKGAKRSIKNSTVTGIQGTYGIYADAYRKAAEARGVLPREMQSITWEAIRGLFEKKWKTKGNKAKVDNLWKKYENGSLTLNETRQAILDLAEGIKDPEWVGRRSNRGTDESLGTPENAEQLPSSELGRQELRSKSRGRVSDAGDASPEVGRQFMPAGEGRAPAPRRAGRAAPQGNRFMAPAGRAGSSEAQLEKFLR